MIGYGTRVTFFLKLFLIWKEVKVEVRHVKAFFLVQKKQKTKNTIPTRYETKKKKRKGGWVGSVGRVTILPNANWRVVR